MKAILSISAGGPETLVLKDVPDPRPADGEVLIRVEACGLNFPDVLVIEDRYQFRPPRPFSPGGEVAGIIVALGAKVNTLSIGDRVIAMVGSGGLAELVTTKAQNCIPFPAAMPFEEAAAFIGTYGTSYHALKQRAQLSPGENILVLGAAGGVGLAAVQLAGAMGARTIAAASSQAKADLAIKNGAAGSVIYPSALPIEQTKVLAGQFKDAAGATGFDVIYDAVGGDYAEPALRSLGWRGRYLIVGFPAGIPHVPFNLPLLKGAAIIGVFFGAFAEKEPSVYARNLEDLFEFYAAGKIRPQITERLQLAEAPHGLELLASRKAQGKIVVSLT